MNSEQLNWVLKELKALELRRLYLRERLTVHCLENYGVDPSDIDNEEFFAAFGGNGGQVKGMTAKELNNPWMMQYVRTKTHTETYQKPKILLTRRSKMKTLITIALLTLAVNVWADDRRDDREHEHEHETSCATNTALTACNLKQQASAGSPQFVTLVKTVFQTMQAQATLSGCQFAITEAQAVAVVTTVLQTNTVANCASVTPVSVVMMILDTQVKTCF